jgi:hypothetical protein
MANNSYERLREEALRTDDTTLLLIAQLCINEGKSVKAMEIMEARIVLLEQKILELATILETTKRKVNACVIEMDIEY